MTDTKHTDAAGTSKGGSTGAEPQVKGTSGDASKASMPIEFYPEGHAPDPPKGPPKNFQAETPQQVSGTLKGTLTGTKIEGTFQPDAPGGKGTPAAPKPAAYNGKTIDQLTDQEVLQLANGFGPSIISQELYDRAQQIQKTNPGGAFGPAILKADFFPSQSPPPSPAPSTTDTTDTTSTTGAQTSSASDPWHSFSQKDLTKIAQQEGVSYKPKASRDDLISALDAAGVAPPPVSDFETYHGPRSS